MRATTCSAVTLLGALALAARCGGGSGQAGEAASPAPPPDDDPKALPTPDPYAGMSPGERSEATAREQVRTFLDLVGEERYEEAYGAASAILGQSYTYEQFLMVAGKLQMEEMGCIGAEDIEAMEPTTGNVGIGAEDIVVRGFAVRYGCGQERDRTLVIFLDWSGEAQPGGVASFYWK